jgi:hypothetical protein
MPILSLAPLGRCFDLNPVSKAVLTVGRADAWILWDYLR